jgi:P pilus assembly chaperone PapD
VRRFAWFAALAIAVVGAMPATAEAQISVDSLIMTLPPAAGGASLTIAVRNEGDEATSVRVDVQDWIREADGTNHFHALGTTAESCNGRLRVSDRTFDLAPGASHALRVIHDGPADDRCRNIIFLRASDLDAVMAGEAVTLVISTGVKVFVERP